MTWFPKSDGTLNDANLTCDNSAPAGDNQDSCTAGENGSVLLQDVQLVQKLQSFTHERFPERIVLACGTGVHGKFVASKDINSLTTAKVFEERVTTC
ncbi:MAG: catalase [Gammaproteobacteria bacterium]|nr:catalase [Gammaproteobacteria bacterium]